MIESEDDNDDDDDRWQGTEVTKVATARWFKGWQVVLPTSHSLSCYVVPVRSETSAAHVYTSTSQPWDKKVRYAYLVLSTTDQMKVVGELTQHVRETTWEVSERDVGQRTVYNDENGDDDGYSDDDDDDDDTDADDNKKTY